VANDNEGLKWIARWQNQAGQDRLRVVVDLVRRKKKIYADFHGETPVEPFLVTDGVTREWDLRGIVLEGDFPPYTNLLGASFSFANFDRIVADHFNVNLCDLNFASVRHATLKNSSFFGNTARGIDFEGSDLEGLGAAGIEAPEASFRDANLREANLAATLFVQADFTRANLSRAGLHAANLRGADFSYAQLRGADLRDADMRGTSFTHAILDGAWLSGAAIDEGAFDEADLRGADVSQLIIVPACARDARGETIGIVGQPDPYGAKVEPTPDALEILSPRAREVAALREEMKQLLASSIIEYIGSASHGTKIIHHFAMEELNCNIEFHERFEPYPFLLPVWTRRWRQRHNAVQHCAIEDPDMQTWPHIATELLKLRPIISRRLKLDGSVLDVSEQLGKLYAETPE
jgi:uncharacterized protein YjbI with pentapeptide repeats